MSDRAVQDEVIRYLADAKVRAQKPRRASISVAEAAKAGRFAHFLARRYYRDRLARSFRYSHRFRRQTGRFAEEVVEAEEFDRFLGQCVMGSLDSVRRVGEMARVYLNAAPEPGPWWQDLLDYEYAYFLQAATAERVASIDRPLPGLSAVCRQFAWALPEILPRLRAGGPIANDLRREVTLMFSRTHAGRIYVVEVEPTMEGIFRAVNGQRTVDEIATAAGVPAGQARSMLTSLADIGAVQPPF
jgi:hypothetical protein